MKVLVIYDDDNHGDKRAGRTASEVQPSTHSQPTGRPAPSGRKRMAAPLMAALR